MKVSTAKPFQIIYSLFQHEYLGYLFESFVVQLDEKERLTFQHQNISSQNAVEFANRLNAQDYELIKLMDSIQQDVIVKKYHKKKIKTDDFFLKYYQDSSHQELKEQIQSYLERKRAQILPLLQGKEVYEMGSDGEPAWRKLELFEEKATVLFHFRRNEENTHYFPTIKHRGQKVEFQYKGAFLVCMEPAWMVIDNQLLSFEKQVDGKKLKPFLNKKFIVIPKKVEAQYYQKFVAGLVAQFDVYAKGFDIETQRPLPKPVLQFASLQAVTSTDLFGNTTQQGTESKMMFELSFHYGPYKLRAGQQEAVHVDVKQQNDHYTFYKVYRKPEQEKQIIMHLQELGLELKHGKGSQEKVAAFSWINRHRKHLEQAYGFTIEQIETEGKRYFLGESSLNIEVKENIDWFDIYAVVRFGQFEVPFNELRKLVQKGKNEIMLPNGQVAVIPEEWLLEYAEFFAFLDEPRKDDETLTLQKHHLAIVQELEAGQLAKVSMDRKLQKLQNFESIEDFATPQNFKGELRPYQKAGYNWLNFLDSYGFGGCLADDMGLGKTVQTLAMLQGEKEKEHCNASLLIMPTSLIYNWQKEAAKFTPNLRVFIYTGTQRNKDPKQFKQYDLVLTSYGIVRLDAEILSTYYFNYIILDESQAIKNPTSNIAKAVKTLKSRRRLLLSGTPLENSTLDLWSQMSFANPGLLGNQSFFKNEFLNPIEKKKDEGKIKRLYTIIKPFILRREKSQVATELPPKVEHIQYSRMTEQQEKVYEEIKGYYRNKILDQIEQNGLNNSQFLLLQGLTKLRQIANHPRMVEEGYEGDSGKLEDVTHMLDSAIQKNHKILVFSQFVKHLSIVRQYLDQQKIGYAYLDGATRNRQQVVEQFQEDPKLPVFLISLKAGGLGLNLTQADYVFILDPWWNPAIEAQAVDRAHRIGQENTVFTYKFITKDTVEEKILALQKHKLKLASELITVEESFVKTLTKENIIDLLN